MMQFKTISNILLSVYQLPLGMLSMLILSIKITVYGCFEGPQIGTNNVQDFNNNKIISTRYPITRLLNTEELNWALSAVIALEMIIS